MSFDRDQLPDPVCYYEAQGLRLTGPRSAARVKVDVAHFMQPIAVFRDATGFLRPRHRAQG